MDDNNCTMLHNGITYKCSIALALSVIGGKWKPLILWHLQGKVLPILDMVSKWGADYCRSINEEAK